MDGRTKRRLYTLHNKLTVREQMEELRTDSGDIVFIGSAKQHAVKAQTIAVTTPWSSSERCTIEISM